MGNFKKNLQERYQQKFMQKYGDRITYLVGTVLSCKVVPKSILFGLYNKVTVTIILKLDNSRGRMNTGKDKTVSQCIYKEGKFFKKPKFIQISTGNIVMLAGLKSVTKGKKDQPKKEFVQIINISNYTTKKDLKDWGYDVQKVMRTTRMK